MSITTERARAFNFYRRYTSNHKNSPAADAVFIQTLQSTRKAGGSCFESYLERIKDENDSNEYSISNEEYHAIKESMAESEAIYFQNFLRDLLSHRLLPKNFDDWLQPSDGVEEYPIVFMALFDYGYIPEGFDHWEQHDENDRCIAHLAAYKNCLPESFTRWDLRDKNGYSVRQVLEFQRFQHVYNLES